MLKNDKKYNEYGEAAANRKRNEVTILNPVTGKYTNEYKYEEGQWEKVGKTATVFNRRKLKKW